MLVSDLEVGGLIFGSFLMISSAECEDDSLNRQTYAQKMLANDMDSSILYNHVKAA